jgi:hypothetical protein
MTVSVGEFVCSERERGVNIGQHTEKEHITGGEGCEGQSAAREFAECNERGFRWHKEGGFRVIPQCAKREAAVSREREKALCRRQEEGEWKCVR